MFVMEGGVDSVMEGGVDSVCDGRWCGQCL